MSVIIGNVWMVSLLVSPSLIQFYLLVKRKQLMSWREFGWWIYGLFYGLFPAYIILSQYLNK
jgi:hypothetical protein